MAALTDAVHHIRRLANVTYFQKLTDGELLDRFILNQDEPAFAELVRRHGPMVLAICRRILRQEQDAEDAFQASFLMLARKAVTIRQRDSVGGWLYQVTRRLARRAGATIRRRDQHLTGLTELEAPATEMSDDSLEAEIARLPETYRSPVVLCYIEGQTQCQAARLLNTTVSSVNSRLKRARQLLRQRLYKRGIAFSTMLLVELQTAMAAHVVSPNLIRITSQAVLSRVSVGGSYLVAEQMLEFIMSVKAKILIGVIVALAAVAFCLTSVQGDPDPTPASQTAAKRPAHAAKRKPARSCIVLWMAGGPSQIDTFDPKPGNLNGGPFRAIDTTIKGVQFAEHLPHLARLANHLTIIRSLTHREGDHVRASQLLRTGRTPGGPIDYPALTSVLAKELGDANSNLPRCISIGPLDPAIGGGHHSGFLGKQFEPLKVGERGFGQEADGLLRLPAAAAFDAFGKGRGEKMRLAVANAFDLAQEKPELRAAYGPDLFGQGCLLARRLIEIGVPVVEVTLPGWDTHANNFELVQKRSVVLDIAFGSLVKDLHERKRLETTLIVCLGEFGRTPRINAAGGRDHWPQCSSVVLAGCGLKRGQVIGKTSTDGTSIEERPVTPPELLAMIYQALGVDFEKEYRTGDLGVPLVNKGTRSVKEALR